MMEASIQVTWILWIKKKFLLSESNEVDDINKASETVCDSSESDPLPVTDTSTDTPCPPEVECLVTTVSVISETTNSNSLLPNTASKNIVGCLTFIVGS